MFITGSTIEKTAFIVIAIPGTTPDIVISEQLFSYNIYGTITANSKNYEFSFIPTKRELDKQLENALLENKSIVINEFNLYSHQRKLLVNYFKKFNYNCVALTFVKPETDEELQQWNHNLSKIDYLSDQTINTMIEYYEPPSTDEGFDNILYYNINGNLLTT
jgi:tRNA uridine 5-carbamoylmethylation protein Kti12